ncbi:MAG: hypothetical protein GEU88_12850 [Solirubrobacterales bacterium]|nr:hypothetical protein [Solirubrobacterales bacterium]
MQPTTQHHHSVPVGEGLAVIAGEPVAARPCEGCGRTLIEIDRCCACEPPRRTTKSAWRTW